MEDPIADGLNFGKRPKDHESKPTHGLFDFLRWKLGHIQKAFLVYPILIAQ